MCTIFSFRSALLAPAMLLLCGIFLQSCTEEMPALKSPSSVNYSTGSASSKSIINLKINDVQRSITNVKPEIIIFNINSGGVALPSFRSYTLAGDNGNTTNRLVYSAAFHSDSVGNNTYIFDASQVIVGQKVYTSFNVSGKSNFKVDKVDEKAYTTSGSFGYYVYDNILMPKDSLYITGSFNIVK
ncbi:MAG: hypothetical protein ACRYFA_06000 [Janthinobacterium lividum]